MAVLFLFICCLPKCKIGGFKPLNLVCFVSVFFFYFVRIIKWVLKVFFIQKKV